MQVKLTQNFDFETNKNLGFYLTEILYIKISKYQNYNSHFLSLTNVSQVFRKKKSIFIYFCFLKSNVLVLKNLINIYYFHHTWFISYIYEYFKKQLFHL